MPPTILVATPHSAFGELIRLSLEDTGLYRIHLAQTLREAQAAAALSVLNLAILDSDLPEHGAAALAVELRKRQPNLPLILIPPDNDPSKAEIPANDYLSLPFFAPDLVEMAARLVTPAEADPPSAPTSAPAVPPVPHPTPYPDTSAPGFTAQFSRALKNTTALAGFILRGQQVEVSSGGLPAGAVTEAVSVIRANLNFNDRCDLVRFARLDSAAGDYLIYATLLAGDLVLGLIYDPFAPLTRIHYQAAVLNRALAAPPPVLEPVAESDTEAPVEDPQALTLDELAAAAEQETPVPAFTSDPDWQPSAAMVEQESAGKVRDTQPVKPPSKGETACVLVLLPADWRVTLSDAAAQVLAAVLPAVCRENQWQPGALAVRSNHALVALRLPPGVEPESALQVIRARFSQELFTALPELRTINLLDNFWLPKALISPGSAIPSAAAVENFIKNARQGQSAPAGT